MNEIAEVIANKEVQIVDRKGNAIVVKKVSKIVSVSGKKFDMNPLELVRMIRNVTQQIGDHKRNGNAYSAYLLPQLRTTRNQMVADLERYFGVSHVISDEGKSIFYKL